MTTDLPYTGKGCIFCAIARGDAPAQIDYIGAHGMIIRPLNPVTEGHLLAIPKAHVEDAFSNPGVTGEAMVLASAYARNITKDGEGCNLITSVGAEATQSVFHLHIHIVPRREGDGLKLPWTGQRVRT